MALHTRGAYFHAVHTNGQIGHTCVGPQKLRWPRAPALHKSVPGYDRGRAQIYNAALTRDLNTSAIVREEIC